MIEFTETFRNESGLIITISRILPNESNFKNFKLIPIQNSAFFYFGNKISNDTLILPKLYAAFVALTGPGDNCYDDYKGSYSFRFELTVTKNNNISKYCYHIYHYRSYIEFSVYHIVPNSDERNPSHYYQPNDNLFSDQDICSFSSHFCNYALKYIEDTNYKPQPFVKYSDSNLLLFGYLKDEFFFKEYEKQDKYIKQREMLKN